MDSGRCGLSLSTATTRRKFGTKCSKTEASAAASPLPRCPTTCTPTGKRASMSATSSEGHITATWTRESRLDERQRVAQHALGELDDVARRVRASQSGLHQALPGSLRHDHHGAEDLACSIIDPASAHVAGPGSA